MDFRAPQCVIDAMHARAEHGVYGYSVPKEEVTMEVIKYLKRTAHYQVRSSFYLLRCCFPRVILHIMCALQSCHAV